MSSSHCDVNKRVFVSLMIQVQQEFLPGWHKHKKVIAWMKSSSMYVYFYNGHLYYRVAESFALHWPLFSFVEQITCLSHGDNLLIPTSPLPLSTLDKWGTYFKYLLCHEMGIAFHLKGLFIELYHAMLTMHGSYLLLIIEVSINACGILFISK